jgi:hypothetical protein
MRENDPPCTERWQTNTSPCPSELGEHGCWRSAEHRTHLCACGEIKIAVRVAAPVSSCGYRWSEGRPCSDREHACQRGGEHATHVCGCLATDTPAWVGVWV